MKIKKLISIIIIALLLPITSVQAACKLEWNGSASLLAPDVASTQWSEVRATISPDGQTMLWGSSDRPGSAGGWDIWMATRKANVWSNPKPVSFNTKDKEFDPAFSPDGHSIYFFSDRADGFGGDDIYRSSFNPKTSTFGVPENLGSDINSKGNEWAPTISSDGKQLLFASNGHEGKGGYDLFVAKRVGKNWRKVMPLSGEVNSAVDEFDATWIDAGRALVFSRSSDIKAEKPINLMLACQSQKTYVAVQVLDSAINVPDGWNFGPSLDSSMPHTLLFTSHHQDAARGKLDLYRIDYRLVSQE